MQEPKETDSSLELKLLLIEFSKNYDNLIGSPNKNGIVFMNTVHPGIAFHEWKMENGKKHRI